jgi:hypothetical protein
MFGAPLAPLRLLIYLSIITGVPCVYSRLS